MKNLRVISPEPQKCFDEASAWQVRLAREPSLEVSPEFQAWISSPDNLRAFQGVNTAWVAAEDFAAEPAILDMRQLALRRARSAGTRRWLGQSLGLQVAAAIVGFCLLGGAGLYYYLSLPTIYATAIGERRTIALADGSHVSLDSDTEINVRYSDQARELNLEHGRAHFDVTHDIARPFSVHAGNETVVAVGTSFDVEKIGSKVMVTLIQGKIVVKGIPVGAIATPAPTRRPAVTLEAGEELVASNGIAPAIKPANLTVASAWQEGRLVFNGDTLGEAIARVNRYTDRPIQVDPAIASIRIVGSFNAGDISTFVSAITSYFPVQATTTANNAVLLQPRT